MQNNIKQKSFLYKLNHALLAQLVERSAVNRKVVGSNPIQSEMNQYIYIDSFRN